MLPKQIFDFNLNICQDIFDVKELFNGDGREGIHEVARMGFFFFCEIIQFSPQVVACEMQILC